MPSLEDRGQREREGRSIQDGRCCMIDGAAARDGASITAQYIRRGRWARPVRSCRCDCCSRATRSAGRRLAARPCTSSPPCPRARRPRSAHTRLRAKVARWRDGRAAGRRRVPLWRRRGEALPGAACRPLRPAATPVPQASVGPAPRSHTFILRWVGESTCTNSVLVLAGKAASTW